MGPLIVVELACAAGMSFGRFIELTITTKNINIAADEAWLANGILRRLPLGAQGEDDLGRTGVFYADLFIAALRALRPEAGVPCP